jgi:leader peptidase (prepilin peptidase)/N-methyltransferase
MIFPFILFLFGLVIGSFFNVCVYRIPKNKSLIYPSSHCPWCKNPIKPYDNIPVLSYILLAGKCRYCKKPISIRYPIIEFLTAVLFAAVGFKFGVTISLARALLFIGFLVVVAFIDLEHQIAPFRVTIPGLFLGLVTSFLLPKGVVSYFIGMLLGGLFVILVWLLWRYFLSGLFQAALGIKQKEGIGWGDLPLTAMIGVYLGWKYLIVALFASVICGVFIGLLLRVLKKSKRGEPIAFGPFLAIGGLVGLFFGPQLINWYLKIYLH